MTLTSILPTLRRSIPDPLDADRWPEHTSATPDDVIVSGVSLCRLAELCGLPCVHTASASLPGTGGLPSPTAECTVAVLEVAEVRTEGEERVIALDAQVDDIGACWSELRLIGRASTAHEHPYLVARTGSRGAGAESARLPGDIQPGDVVAVPCRVPLTAVRLRRR
ncbi:hypothetical protein [Agromyces italicus]|uniref:hypothetical protein n=1 Tax=Agromyces italicus TaxID=279572 RepID=UPI0003B6992D|nr:hypothetical protein [Agromyces italicus]